METTIKISSNTKAMLDKIKIHERETYNDVIEVMLEDHLELNEKTKNNIESAKKEIEKGNFYTQEEVERMFGIK